MDEVCHNLFHKRSSYLSNEILWTECCRYTRTPRSLLQPGASSAALTRLTTSVAGDAAGRLTEVRLTWVEVSPEEFDRAVVRDPRLGRPLAAASGDGRDAAALLAAWAEDVAAEGPWVDEERAERVAAEVRKRVNRLRSTHRTMAEQGVWGGDRKRRTSADEGVDSARRPSGHQRALGARGWDWTTPTEAAEPGRLVGFAAALANGGRGRDGRAVSVAHDFGGTSYKRWAQMRGASSSWPSPLTATQVSPPAPYNVALREQREFIPDASWLQPAPSPSRHFEAGRDWTLWQSTPTPLSTRTFQPTRLPPSPPPPTPPPFGVRVSELSGPGEEPPWSSHASFSPPSLLLQAEPSIFRAPRPGARRQGAASGGHSSQHDGTGAAEYPAISACGSDGFPGFDLAAESVTLQHLSLWPVINDAPVAPRDAEDSLLPGAEADSAAYDIACGRCLLPMPHLLSASTQWALPAGAGLLPFPWPLLLQATERRPRSPPPWLWRPSTEAIALRGSATSSESPSWFGSAGYGDGTDSLTRGSGGCG